MYGAEIGEFVCGWSKTLSTGAASGYSREKKMGVKVCSTIFGGHVAAAQKRSHQWCISLTPNNTKTIGRMICHCFLLLIRRDLTSSSYTTHFLPPTEAAGRPFYVVIWATQDGHFMWSFEPRKGLATCSSSIGPSMGIKLGPPTLQSNALLTELILAICILRSFSLRWTCWIGTILQRQSGDQLTDNQRKMSGVRILILFSPNSFHKTEKGELTYRIQVKVLSCLHTGLIFVSQSLAIV